MELISLGIVAEKSSRWRSSGTWLRIVCRLSAKPIVSISSASSRTTVLILSRLAAPRSMRSIRRPGVATITSTPRRRVRI